MKTLKVIRNKDVGVKNKKVKYRIRKAARAVLFNKDRVALLNVSKLHYHKIPGGGVETGENIKKALAREIMEETGCTAIVGEIIGIIEEYRDDFKLKQISYCYIAEVVKCGDKPFFTKKEINNGFKLIWVTLDEAIKLLKNDKPEEYEGKFIVIRALEFLERAKLLVK